MVKRMSLLVILLFVFASFLLLNNFDIICGYYTFSRGGGIRGLSTGRGKKLNSSSVTADELFSLR